MPPESARQPVNPKLVINMVCKDLGITTADLRSTMRRNPLPMARSIIAHALHMRVGSSFPEIARLINMSQSSALEAHNRLWMGRYDSKIQHYLPEFTDPIQYTRSVFNLCEEASQTP